MLIKLIQAEIKILDGTQDIRKNNDKSSYLCKFIFLFLFFQDHKEKNAHYH